MPAKTLVVEKPVRKKLLKLPSKVHQRLISKLDEIQANPIVGTKLHGELSEYYKIRVGDYRIVYTFDAKESRVDVVKIEHRQGVYK
ncbi:type II toxin-antitoxin system RelE/ParE family toxin [Candidatus Microgenomates bacterium]|nr:type II toxin-antitoxin system RelE/ParE family toxin [Candidatus Microgenomates bacterium]